MMKKRTARIVLLSIAALASIAAARLALWSGPRPLCHRAIDGAFFSWMLNTGHTNVYPNADGMGRNSLELAQKAFGMDLHQYAYVPGLHADDPKDLVLIYLRKQTRYTWHSDMTHTIFSPKRWMVVSPDITTGACPEGGDLLETREFKRRIQNTVAFLREHQRPYWQAVAEEQSNFIKTLKD